LPASDDAFKACREEISPSLEDIRLGQSTTGLSSYGAIVVAASLYGQLVHHLHRKNKRNRPDDVANGHYWHRHHEMDTLFSKWLMILPSSLRYERGNEDCNTFFANLNFQALIVCLHQAAIVKAGLFKLDAGIIHHSQQRSDAASEEMIRIMRLVPKTPRFRVNCSWKSSYIQLLTEN
jgi:hypothetical protein